MTPKIATDIVARDKTDAGIKSAERRFGAFGRKAAGLSKEGGGVGKLGKQLEGLGKFRTLNFDAPAGSLSSISAISGQVAGNIGAMTTNVLGFGGAAQGVLGTIAEGAGAAAAAVAGTAATVVGLGAATYALGDKWAKTGAEIGRTARTLGVSADFLQRARAENERFGVSAEATTSSVDGLATTLYDAKAGANNLALGALTQLGVKLKTNKDGVVDLAAAYYDLSDAIARQKDPNVQRKLAAVFGLSGALPAIREGSATLKAQGSDYAATGAELSDDEVKRAIATNRSTVALRQRLGAVEKTAGVAAMSVTGAAADKGGEILRDPSKALTILQSGASQLASGGADAARALVRGGEHAGRALAGAVADLMARGERAATRDRAETATRFFARLGFSPEQAQGMTAGAYAESKLNPHSVNPTSGAIGIGQWLGSRKAELLRRYGSNPTFSQQLEFMGWELTHTEKPAAAAIQSATNPTAALSAYVRRFMRPAPGDETTGDLHRGGRFLEANADLGAAALGPTELAQATTPPPMATPAKAQVEIVLRGAPSGTVTKVTGAGPDLDVSAHVVRSLDTP